MCLLLEGLWHNWGFYFTARSQPGELGSSDLEETLMRLEKTDGLVKITEENITETLRTNGAAAHRRFLQLLVARMIIFRIFLQCAISMPYGITEGHKGRWLLLQAAPVTLMGGDIFAELTRKLIRASSEYIEDLFDKELTEVVSLFSRCQPRPPTLVTVLDEAQVILNLLSTCFRSNEDPNLPRPILCELLSTWTPLVQRLIVSGTGMSMQLVESVLASAVAKEDGSHPPETVTDLGAFDNEKDQREYLEKYLPPGFLDTPSGNAVATRAGYWLHGR